MMTLNPYKQEYKEINLENFDNCSKIQNPELKRIEFQGGELFNSCSTKEDKFNNIMMPYNIDVKLNILIILVSFVLLLVLISYFFLFRIKKKYKM
jgi:hypothetical protein